MLRAHHFLCALAPAVLATMLALAPCAGHAGEKDVKVEVNVLAQPLDYKRGYMEDLKNFILPPIHSPQEFNGATAGKLGRTGTRWLVLFNAHGDAPLYTGGEYKPGMRSLSWGTPYDAAFMTITKGDSAHDYSALLTNWSKGEIRKFGTFVCIPPKSDMRFWSGYAAPQQQTEKSGNVSEFRPGGGMQWRLYMLPEKTICLTCVLFTTQTKKAKTDAFTGIDLQERFKVCITEYNKKATSAKLPADLYKPHIHGKKLLDNNDDQAIMEYYMDKSLTKLRTYDKDQDVPKKK